MQNAKDSFYVALRDRLATLNPDRTVSVEGVTRPGILVTENEPLLADAKQSDVFYLSWGKVQLAAFSQGSTCPLLICECDVSYSAEGYDEDGYSRGRSLGAMDSELLSMCTPRNAVLFDYTSSPAQPTGGNVFWSSPEWQEASDSHGRLERAAKISVFFFEEQAQ